MPVRETDLVPLMVTATGATVRLATLTQGRRHRLDRVSLCGSVVSHYIGTLCVVGNGARSYFDGPTLLFWEGIVPTVQ